MQDAWQAYLGLALGVTKASQKKAENVARQLVGKGGATAGQLQAFAGELVSTSRANREELAKLVRYEVDRALGAVGLATAEEVAELTARVRALEREASGRSADAGPPQASTAAPQSAPQTAAKKTAAKKTTAKKTTAKKTAANKTTAEKSTRTGRTRHE